jgi:hypothetical protein
MRGKNRRRTRGVTRRYWMDPAAFGSSLISPKVDSYCDTFCCKTFDRALACCGLRKMP